MVLASACAPPALELRTATVHLTVHIEGNGRIPELLREKLLALRDCYGAGSSGSRDISVEISMTFDRRGRVKSLSSPATLTGYVQRCVKDRVARWRIGVQPRERSFGPYVIRFAPPSGGPLSGPGGPSIRFSGRRRMQEPPPRRSVSRRRVAPPRPRARVKSNAVGRRVRANVRARVYGLRSCYNRGLINNPRLSGSVKVSFMIMPSGRLTSVKVVSDMGLFMIRCVRDKVLRWNLGKVPKSVFYGPFAVRFTPWTGK